MFMYGTEYSTSRAWTGSLVLLALVFGFFVLARRLGATAAQKAHADSRKAGKLKKKS
jgi:ABC-type phosphate transport system permease subunit